MNELYIFSLLPKGRELLLISAVLMLFSCSKMTPTTASHEAANKAAFDQDLEQYFDLLQLPAMAVGVARGDSLIFFKGKSRGPSGSNELISPDHIFSIASLTKGFTAVVLSQMEAEGQLSLTDPIAKYENKYFDPGRIRPDMTIAHIISHTAESAPPGQMFIYNGGLYNLVFNAFDDLSPIDDPDQIARPYTYEIEERIIRPLGLTHTLTNGSRERFDSLQQWMPTPYNFQENSGQYEARPYQFDQLFCGPSTGLLSSVQDLAVYSAALGKGDLISPEAYQRLTTPFYPGSPYGLGWFTMQFAGHDLHWAYGYGNADAALILRVPDQDLTLITLFNTDMPSASIRLGYGNVLDSPLAVSFLKNFVLHLDPARDLVLTASPSDIGQQLSRLLPDDPGGIYMQSILAQAMVLANLPRALNPDTSRSAQLLQLIQRQDPDFFQTDRRSIFELLANAGDPAILSIAGQLADHYDRMDTFHPVNCYFTGLIREKNQGIEAALPYYRRLADENAFPEQFVTFNTLLKLGEYYLDKEPALAKGYLEKLMRNKEMISSQDGAYNKAKTLLSQHFPVSR